MNPLVVVVDDEPDSKLKATLRGQSDCVAFDPEQKGFENICSPHCVPAPLHGLTS